MQDLLGRGGRAEAHRGVDHLPAPVADLEQARDEALALRVGEQQLRRQERRQVAGALERGRREPAKQLLRAEACLDVAVHQRGRRALDQRRLREPPVAARGQDLEVELEVLVLQHVRQLVREHHLVQHPVGGLRALDDPQPVLARVVVAGDRLTQRRRVGLPEVGPRRHQSEQHQHVGVGATARGRVVGVERLQPLAARLLRRHLDRHGRALELEAALALDPLHDPRHAVGPQRGRRRLVAVVEHERERREHERQADDDGERHASIVRR